MPGSALAVQAADCAPVVLRCDGAIGVVHAGWRGIMRGVVRAAVTSLRVVGDGEVSAVIGPCIRPHAYTFGEDDLAVVADLLGDGVRGTAADGAPALDLPAAVRAGLAATGVDDVEDGGVCTVCSPVHYSYRARAETARHAAVVWLE